MIRRKIQIRNRLTLKKLGVIYSKAQNRNTAKNSCVSSDKIIKIDCKYCLGRDICEYH